MSIEDTNPERRNLRIASLAFIAYFYGGGQLPDNTISLQIVELIFSRPAVLAVLAWILLFWFAYRYWVVNRNKFSEGYSKEIETYYTTEEIQRFLRKSKGIEFAIAGSEGYYVASANLKSKKPVLRYVYAKGAQVLDDGSIHSFHSVQDDKSGTVELSDFGGYLFRLRLMTICILGRPSFSSYLVPYLVFITAVLGPAADCALTSQ